MPYRGTKYWRDRAIEIRASAERTRDALARDTLLDIAKKYDLMAKIAAEHEGRIRNPKRTTTTLQQVAQQEQGTDKP